jgi:hypothetical protein
MLAESVKKLLDNGVDSQVLTEFLCPIVTFSGAVVSAGVRLVGSHDSGPAAHRL